MLRVTASCFFLSLLASSLRPVGITVLGALSIVATAVALSAPRAGRAGGNSTKSSGGTPPNSFRAAEGDAFGPLDGNATSPATAAPAAPVTEAAVASKANSSGLTGICAPDHGGCPLGNCTAAFVSNETCAASLAGCKASARGGARALCVAL